MKPRRGTQAQPKVAVIGSGLAGLSAAYHLRDKADVTIFEKEDRIGGRILTMHKPWGEHGAQFLLDPRNERSLNRLIKELGLKLHRWKSWPGYMFRRKLVTKKPSKVVKKLLPPESAKRVNCLLDHVKNEAWKNPESHFDRWLADFLRKDREAMAFIEMLVAGETCAPNSHITARYGLECLSSLYNDWYSIRGGTVKLIDALAEKSGARIIHDARVDHVKEIRCCVRVDWTEGGERKSGDFTAAIITTPDGEQLVNRTMLRHYHAYTSILLEYKRCPRLRANPNFDLSRGLYTDGPLNYIQLTKLHGLHTLRILMPNADTKLGRKEQDLAAYCVAHLRPLIIGADQPLCSSVKKWQLGLPCGRHKNNDGFQKIGCRIFLAGDRFGKWPSMDAAVFSGFAAGTSVTHEL